MIFLTRRKSGSRNDKPIDPPVVLVETSDADFSLKITTLLSQWEYRVCPLDLEIGDESDGVDVVLFDIRGVTEDAFGVLAAIRKKHPGIEVVLINRPDNVAASIAGMRAGACDELILPFDTATLRTAVTEACARRQAARERTAKKSLLSCFSDAMMAATFAQAGDFDGALELLEGHSRPIDNQSADKKYD